MGTGTTVYLQHQVKEINKKMKASQQVTKHQKRSWLQWGNHTWNTSPTVSASTLNCVNSEETRSRQTAERLTCFVVFKSLSVSDCTFQFLSAWRFLVVKCLAGDCRRFSELLAVCQDLTDSQGQQTKHLKCRKCKKKEKKNLLSHI